LRPKSGTSERESLLCLRLHSPSMDIHLSLRLVNICVVSVLIHIKKRIIVCLLYRISIRLQYTSFGRIYCTQWLFRLDKPNRPWCNTSHRLMTTRKIARKNYIMLDEMTSSLVEHRHDKHESQKPSLHGVQKYERRIRSVDASVILTP